jgi:hypothetical protein
MVTNDNKIEDADKQKKNKKEKSNSGPCTYRKNHAESPSTAKH